MSTHIPKFIPVTDLRQDISSVLRSLSAGEEPIVVMQRSRAAAVMLRVETYERMVREREILGLLAMGEKDIAAAKGYSIEQLLADIDDEDRGGSK